MKMTTEEAFVKTLQMHGIDNAFGIIGSAMMPISDIFPDAGIKFWDCAHETSGGMMADGYTRATGKPGVVLVTSGPGATNAVNLPASRLADPDAEVQKLKDNASRLAARKSSRSNSWGRFNISDASGYFQDGQC